ncbi:MAG: acyltransferase [Bacteroidia bacterium]|nr:acyltransferase [Bacteroidia bacterium]
MSDRVRFLDGLRGILACIVFVHHFFYAFWPNIVFGGPYEEFSSTSAFSGYKLIALTPLNILYNPGMAIHFFFLLSGYVQTYNYFHKPDFVFLQKSFIKRYFRLAIPTLSVLLLVFLFHRAHLFTKDLIPQNSVTSGWVKSLLPDNLNLFQVIRHGLVECFSVKSNYYQVLWTMPTELANSWMVLILLFITHRLKNATRVFVLWLLAQVFLMEAYYGAAFTLGMLICSVEKNIPKFSAYFGKTYVRFLCLSIGLYFASYPFVGYVDSTKNSFYGPISFFEKVPHIISYLFGDLLLFCFFLHSERSKNFLAQKLFLFLGNISFMFYLVHFLILLSFTPWVFNVLSFHVGFTTNILLSGLSTFMLVLGASYILYKYVDRLTLRLCSLYLKKLFNI